MYEFVHEVYVLKGWCRLHCTYMQVTIREQHLLSSGWKMKNPLAADAREAI